MKINIKKELHGTKLFYRHGWLYRTAVTECKFYLPYLTEKITQMGGVFIQQRLTSLEEVCIEYTSVKSKDYSVSYAYKTWPVATRNEH